MEKLQGDGLKIMQMHGNEDYIKAFIEYGFHPLKRYKCFTRSVLVLAWSFAPLLFQKFMEVDVPILGFFSVGVGAIVSVLLIVLCNGRGSLYLNRFIHDGLISLDFSVSMLLFAYQEVLIAMGPKPWIFVLLCLAWIIFVTAVIVIRRNAVMRGYDYRLKERGQHSNIEAYAAMGGVLGIFSAKLMPMQEKFMVGMCILCSLLASIGTLNFLKVYYVKKYHLTADTDTK